jgi:hypothetical protein
MWARERLARSFEQSPTFSLCCERGTVRLPLLQETLDPLRLYHESNLPQHKRFREQIRVYNSALAFTSVGVKLDDHFTWSGGVPTYRIHGQLSHRIGSLLPEQTGGQSRSMFAQLYIHDTSNELHNRQATFASETMQDVILENLQDMLHQYNPYAVAFRNVSALLRETPGVTQLTMRIVTSRTKDLRTYNTLIADEVATILIGDGSENAAQRDIVLCTSSGGLQYINELHPSYMPLQYPLLFPRGEDGWHPNIPKSNGTFVPENTKNEKVTQAEFFGLRMQSRTGKSQSLLRGGCLLQQYIMDTWASLEQNRLQYLRRNQAKLQAKVYQGVQDAAMLGRRIVLPSSFQSGPRLMMQNYQDAMAIARFAGKPTYFATLTCNPKWPEITDALLPGQQAHDRPDLIVQAFRLRLAELKRDLFDVGVLGACVAHVNTVEFQKRGLPHVHILMWIHRDAVSRTTADVDQVICVEIPNGTTDPLLYAMVTSSMMHGPCGPANPNAPCCKETSECAKKFPKPFADVTKIETDGYPVYRRRPDGQTVVVKDVELDNHYVVPYNPYLCKKFNAHINVEVCSHTIAIKYLFKYIYKGLDRATVEIASATAQNGGEEAGHNE